MWLRIMDGQFHRKENNMEIIKRGDLRLLLSDEGKHIRLTSDVYVPEHIDTETGEIVPEHFTYYAEMIFLG